MFRFTIRDLVLMTVGWKRMEKGISPISWLIGLIPFPWPPL